jgi:hypothetical protein
MYNAVAQRSLAEQPAKLGIVLIYTSLGKEAVKRIVIPKGRLLNFDQQIDNV